MRTLSVGVAECKVSGDVEAVLVTYALGSCVAVSIYDPVARVGGLLHLMLPANGSARSASRPNPFMFADTGLPLMLQQAGELGAEKRRLLVCLAGGAQMMDENGVFNIGRRNQAAVRNYFWKAGLFVHAEALGGQVSRTAGLELKSGRFWVREQGLKELELFAPVRAIRRQ
jgi:chemotaxis protein CheD